MTKPIAHTGMAKYLSRKLMPLSAGIALLIAVLAPVTFWTYAHRNLQHMVFMYAENLASQLQRVALESPALWKYQTYKFITITDGFHPTLDLTGLRVLDEKGELIFRHDYHKVEWEESGKNLSFTKEFEFSLITAPIMFNDRRVGTVELLADDRSIMRTSAILFFLSSLVGAALAVLVFRFPVRVVRKMEGEIDGLFLAVQRSEAMYRSLLENIPDVAWTRVREGSNVFMSFRCQEILGYTPAELCTAKASHWFDSVHPDDRERVTKAFENLFNAGTAFNEEYRWRRKDGRWVWLLDRAAYSLEQDGKKYADGLLSDISERKQLEEALRSANEFSRVVMDSIDDAIAIIDVGDYRITGCNAGFLKVFGLAMEQVVEKRCYELTHHQPEPCSPPFGICPMKATVTTGNYSVAEHVHFLKNGEKFIAEVATSPIFDESGKVVRVVHVSRDISARKHLEEEREKLIQELQEALQKVKTLSGLLPICSSCKKIRNDKGSWEKLEAYIAGHSEAAFTHGLCPECIPKYFGGLTKP